MILGIGVDIANNSRFIDMKDGLKAKLFTSYELASAEKAPSESEYLASRFAAKEAFAKALGTGFRSFSPTDIEVRVDIQGKPFISLAKPIFSGRIHVSLSHEREMSIAMVVLEDGKS